MTASKSPDMKAISLTNSVDFQITTVLYAPDTSIGRPLSPFFCVPSAVLGGALFARSISEYAEAA